MERVSFAWPDHHPLLDVRELVLRAGEQLFVSGPSASGKSTLLGLIAGTRLPTAGTVRLFGQDVASLGAPGRDRLRGEEMGFVFPQGNLIGYLSVLENVLLPLRFAPRRRARIGGRADARRQADALLAQLGISGHTSTRRPHELSSGQQQRVAVARALLGSPRLIVCDEPTAALDAETRDGFLDLLSSECTRTHSALVFVSHDRGLARHFPRSVDMHELNPLLRAPAGH